MLLCPKCIAHSLALCTWGQWAIAMHGRYESHLLFISITCVYYIQHHDIVIFFYYILYFRYTVYECKQVNHSSRSIMVCLFNTAVCDL
jgi:hypothetical protein